MPLKEIMEYHEAEVSVVDVYDIASEIGKQFEKIIDCYGSDAVTGLMPKVITALEHLEVLATKNERENSNVQDLEAKILKLESDKLEKAEDRIQYERDLEQIEDHWKKETQDLEAVVSTLQEENRKLKNALAAKQDIPAQEMSPEVDIAVLQRLRGMVDDLRDKLRKAEREISSKNLEIDELSGQVKRLTSVKKDLSRKNRVMQFQMRDLIEERADLIIKVQDLAHDNTMLKEQLGKAVNEKSLPSNACSDSSNQPRFTTTELKDLLHERNHLKARVSDLEDELESFRPKKPESRLAKVKSVSQNKGGPPRKKFRPSCSNPLESAAGATNSRLTALGRGLDCPGTSAI